MKLRDAVESAAANLRRMKLRTSLTVAGVVIAIAAFVSMLSFGVGMQRNVRVQFETLGLFSTLHVYPGGSDGRRARGAVAPVPDSLRRPLDAAALARFAALPGVRLAYPFDEFPLTAALGDSVVSTTAQALPEAALRTRLYATLRAGTAFTADSARQAVVTASLLRQVGITRADSAVGRRLVVTTRVATIDSGLVHAVRSARRLVVRRVMEGYPDSLFVRAFWRGLGRDVTSGALSGFLGGLMTARRTVSDTLTVSGVLDDRAGRQVRTARILIPSATAARLNSGDISDDPTSLMAMVRGGRLPGTPGLAGADYPRVTVDLDPDARYEAVRDSIQAMGYRTFSFADEFKEVRRFFLYFNLGLSLVGLIALLTASLGIVNTMVMSILERTREIGVLKALGADERDIRLLFLVESGLIGVTGASLGVVFGWLLTLVATRIAHGFMIREGMPTFPIFAFPFWLVAGAIGFGLLVSLAAGLYPAARAARVDPVDALRHD